jgi:hypothetical protein
MPKFSVLRQQDAFVGYIAVVDANDAKAAADLAYAEPHRFKWEHSSIVEFDACRVVTLDEDNQEIESTERGRF